MLNKVTLLDSNASCKQYFLTVNEETRPTKFLIIHIFYRLHYICSTNAGLCQGNMTWCIAVQGSQYHWVSDLYTRLNLPVLPAVVQALEKSVKERAIELQNEKSDEANKGRVRMKVAGHWVGQQYENLGPFHNLVIFVVLPDEWTLVWAGRCKCMSSPLTFD